MKKIKRVLILLPLIIIAGVAIKVAIPYLNDYKKQKEEEKVYEELAEDFKKDKTHREKLKLDNADYVGIIEIPGMKFCYPVMQTKKEPDYYLNHDIRKRYSFMGTPYLSAYCDLKESDNLIIYGHNINGGRMFGALDAYKSQEFWKEHRSIDFTTDKKREYQIFAVMSVNIYEFEYWKFTMARDESDYNKFVQEVKKRSMYDTGVQPEYGEQIITLSTCDNGRGNNWRLVVLGRKKGDD